ncbi:MAG: GNAT family N-acetyltransferase [Candidatus Omnitrophica bacterium]|nr:GNAT family N-acetyltransferase [Candidatus Omnitrophota bacterium]MDD5311257.1 GNAT family N-acetyltransferase [Candidatus Omnitrophota bacterium]MDD5546962.1 GNAT family N-acetyltransferase [Candidatus Omnitrophota bacterium]
MTAGSGFNVKIARKIEEIPVGDWNKLMPAAGENYFFLKTLDESKMPQFSFFYILVYDKDIPVGATSCFVMNFGLDFGVTGKLKGFARCIKNIFPFIFNPRILICGLPNGQGRIGIAAAEPGVVVKAICEGMEQIAKEAKAKVVVFKDFSFRYRDILDKCLEDGFFRTASLPFTEMDIRFRDFNGYLGTLSYASRSGLRRKFKKIDEEVKFDLEVKGRLEEDELKEAYALYLQTFGRKEVGLEKVPVDFFRNISGNMPEETKFFLWRTDKKMVAFSYCLASGGRFIDYFLGFDYSIAFRFHLYFIRFRDQLDWCINNNIRLYEFGTTGYESKRRLGFRLVPSYNYVKHRNKFLNPVVRVFSRNLVEKLYKFFSKRKK